MSDYHGGTPSRRAIQRQLNYGHLIVRLTSLFYWDSRHLHRFLALRIQRTGGLVQQQNFRLRCYCSGDGQTLLLSTGQRDPTGSNHCFIALNFMLQPLARKSTTISHQSSPPSGQKSIISIDTCQVINTVYLL